MRPWLIVIVVACTGTDAVPGLDAPAAVDARAADDARVRCAGYERVSGLPDARYKAYIYRGIWGYARSQCDYDGAALVVIDDATEAAAIAGFIADDPTGASPWIGVHTVDGAWTAIDGRPATYLPWADGEPGAGGCVALDTGGTLTAGDCAATRYYACECVDPPPL